MKINDTLRFQNTGLPEDIFRMKHHGDHSLVHRGLTYEEFERSKAVLSCEEEIDKN